MALSLSPQWHGKTLAGAVYGVDFVAGPLNNDNVQPFLDAESRQTFMFKVFGEVHKVLSVGTKISFLILRSPQVGPPFLSTLFDNQLATLHEIKIMDDSNNLENVIENVGCWSNTPNVGLTMLLSYVPPRDPYEPVPYSVGDVVECFAFLLNEQSALGNGTRKWYSMRASCVHRLEAPE